MGLTSASDFIRRLRASDPDSLDELRRMATPCLERLASQHAERGTYRESNERFVERGMVFCRLWLLHLSADQVSRLDAGSDPVKAVGAAVQVALVRYFSRRRTDAMAADSPSGGVAGDVSTSNVSNVPRFRIELSVRPLEEVGGDFTDVSSAEGLGPALGMVRVVVGDVAGHGWLAHLVAEGCRRLIPLVSERAARPEEILEGLHAELRPVMPAGVYVEISAALFEPGGTARAAYSGHCWQLLGRRSGRSLSIERLGGMFVGLDFDWSEDCFEARESCLEVGDELVLGSDGIFEQPASDGRMLSSHLDDLAANPFPDDVSLHELVWGLYESAAQDSPPKDDATLVSVRRRPPTCDECPELICPDLCEQQLLSPNLKDSPAAEGLYRLLCDKVRRSVLQIVPNESDADDVMQIAFFRLIRKLHQWKHDCPLCLFFRVIAVREALRLREAQRNRRTVSLDEGFDVAAGGAVSVELRDCLEAKTRSFPLAWREVLRMKLDGVPHEQIARELGVRSRATIQTWLSRMREVFRDCVS